MINESASSASKNQIVKHPTKENVFMVDGMEIKLKYTKKYFQLIASSKGFKYYQKYIRTPVEEALLGLPTFIKEQYNKGKYGIK